MTIMIIYLIYQYFNNASINYLAISDNVMAGENNYNKYVYEYLKNRRKINSFNTYYTNYTASLVYQNIISNRTIRINNEDYYFKKALRESDITVISVGMEELANNYQKYAMQENYDYFNKMYLDIEKLIIEIRKYAQDQVVFLGFYNPTNYYDAKVDEFFYDVDIKLNRLMVQNNIIYLDLYELVKGNSYKRNNLYLSNLGHKKIADSLEFYIA